MEVEKLVEYTAVQLFLQALRLALRVANVQLC